MSCLFVASWYCEKISFLNDIGIFATLEQFSSPSQQKCLHIQKLKYKRSSFRTQKRKKESIYIQLSYKIHFRQLLLLHQLFQKLSMEIIQEQVQTLKVMIQNPLTYRLTPEASQVIQLFVMAIYLQLSTTNFLKSVIFMPTIILLDLCRTKLLLIITLSLSKISAGIKYHIDN